jgi:hypothetical protein
VRGIPGQWCVSKHTDVPVDVCVLPAAWRVLYSISMNEISLHSWCVECNWRVLNAQELREPTPVVSVCVNCLIERCVLFFMNEFKNYHLFVV